MQTFGLFGHPPAGLVAVPPDAQQSSPLLPGSADLTDLPEGTLAGMVMLAAPGTLERRHDLAAMLMALAPGAPFTVLAPKDMGGARLAGELQRDEHQRARRQMHVTDGADELGATAFGGQRAGELRLRLRTHSLMIRCAAG